MKIPKFLFSTNNADIARINPLKSFISATDTTIQIFNIGSIAIIIGLFVNFIFDITTHFSFGNAPSWYYGNMYILLNLGNIFIFYIVVKKYLSFTSSWMRMQRNFSNNKGAEKDILLLLNKSGELITNHYNDFTRYICVFLFIFFIINRKMPQIISANSISFEPRLFFLGLLLYLFIIALIEWPTINLYFLYKQHISHEVKPMESMDDGL